MENKTIIEQVKQQLQNWNEDCEILEIYRTGSQLFRESPHDLDIGVICKGLSFDRKRIYIREYDLDLIFYEENAMKEQLFFNDKYKNLWIYNYFSLFRDKIYGNWDFEYNISQYRDMYLKYLTDRYNKKLAWSNNKHRATKHWVHYYILLKVLIEGKTEITQDMKNDIELLYNSSDGEQLPIIDWIEHNLT